MRKIILNLTISLDGYIEGPSGEFDWCFTDQDYGMTEFLGSIDAILYGRKSYELMLTMEEDYFPNQKKYVISNTLKTVEDGWKLINGDVEAEVKRMKESDGKDIWLFGGSSLLSSILDWDLVDEMMLAIHPLLLGGGTPLFPQIAERKWLTHLKTVEYSSGLVQITYDMRGAAPEKPAK